MVFEGGGGFDEVDEAAEDADLAFKFDRINEGFVRDLDEVEAHEFENEDGNVDCLVSGRKNRRKTKTKKIASERATWQRRLVRTVQRLFLAGVKGLASFEGGREGEGVGGSNTYEQPRSHWTGSNGSPSTAFRAEPCLPFSYASGRDPEKTLLSTGIGSRG